MKKVICAIIKNEHKFFKEWVEWHLNLGFDEIYIFEDFNSDSHKGIVEDERIHISNVSDYEIPVLCGFRQHNLYAWFLNNYKDRADWCAFIDADEFMMLEDAYTLDKLCAEFSSYSGIYLYWKTMGANGHVKSPGTPLVTTYTRQNTTFQAKYGWDYKSFVNMRKATGWVNIHKICEGVNTKFGQVDRMVGSVPVYEKAWINHYQTKSWEDWVNRMKGGAFSYNFRNADTFFAINPDMAHLKEELVRSIKDEYFPSINVISRELDMYTGGNVKFLGLLNRKEYKETTELPADEIS